MKTAEAQVMLGVRIPAELKGKLAGYCEKSGIKLSYLVTQAIREKLEEIAEDEADLKLALKRKNERAKTRKGDYITLSSYARKSGIKI
jgi:predicted DNA-binding protein